MLHQPPVLLHYRVSKGIDFLVTGLLPTDETFDTALVSVRFK